MLLGALSLLLDMRFQLFILSIARQSPLKIRSIWNVSVIFNTCPDRIQFQASFHRSIFYILYLNCIIKRYFKYIAVILGSSQMLLSLEIKLTLSETFRKVSVWNLCWNTLGGVAGCEWQEENAQCQRQSHWEKLSSWKKKELFTLLT